MTLTVPQILVMVGILAITALCFIFGGKKINGEAAKDIKDIIAEMGEQ